MPVKSPYPETQQRTGRQNKLPTDPHFHPELFYSTGYIIAPPSLANPDRRAGMNNTEVMPHGQGWEQSRNGVLWVKRSSLFKERERRTSFASQVYLEALACSSLGIPTGIQAPRVSIPQEQSHNSSTLCPGGSSPVCRGWAGGAGLPPHPQQHLRHQQVWIQPLGMIYPSRLHSSSGTALDKQLGT